MRIHEAKMVNPRRNSYGGNNQTPENPYQSQSYSLISLLNLLKKPQAFPFLLSIFLLLTWVSLKLQHSSHFSSLSYDSQILSKEEDLKANLVRFLPSKLAKDKRGWLLNPVDIAHDAGISGIIRSFQFQLILLLVMNCVVFDFRFKQQYFIICNHNMLL